MSAPPSTPDWTPLVVIGNTRAGDNDGETYLNAFRGQLNAAQVIDLGQLSAEDGLHWCDLVPEGVRCLVLVAGGDGTIGSEFFGHSSLSGFSILSFLYIVSL